MPNHVENRLKIIGNPSQIQEVKKFLSSNNGDDFERNIDFENITPVPKWVYQGDLSSKDEEKYGKENCWYEWNIKNWGTKWNAYKSSLDDTENTIRFRTAWVGVKSLMMKLGFIFPEIEFEYAWASEDFGYDVGLIRFKDTKILEEKIPDGGTSEAYNLACAIRQETLREHYINDDYEYDERLEEEEI